MESRFFAKTLGAKLLMYFLLLALLPTCILGFVGSAAYSVFSEQQANEYTGQIIAQVSRDIDTQISRMEAMMQYIGQEERTLEFMRSSLYRPEVDEQMRRELEPFLQQFYQTDSSILGILLVSRNSKYFSNELVAVTQTPLTGENWFRETVELEQPALRIYPYHVGRNLVPRENSNKYDPLSLTYPVRDPETGENIGVILMDINLHFIQQVVDEISFGKEGFLFAVDQSGEILSSPVNDVVYRLDNRWLGKNDAISTQEVRGTTYQLISTVSPYSKISTVGVFSLDETLAAVRQIRKYSVLFALFTLLLAVMLSLVFTNSIEEPIFSLKQLMKRAEEGDLTVRFAGGGEDEISQLGGSFNRMIEKIGELVELVYQEQKSKREVELRVLHEQIKPHFLYNTLDTIQWIAQRYHVDEIVHIVGSLSTLFRLGLSGGNQMVSLYNELTHARSYLEIQKVRYEDKLEYDIEYEEELAQCKVLKVLLQPVIENAIIHGIQAKPGKGSILVSAYQEKNTLVLSVTDDGVGLSSEALIEANRKLNVKPDAQQKSGYGLYNINERIQLAFGKEYGVRIFSSLGEGTTVEIRHPLLTGENGERSDKHVHSADRR
ncbi:MAG: cache domain-containing sensor histidine kinase [Eubacteriales bacterium]|jgi:two-component system sensor histidine kinase YesM